MSDLPESWEWVTAGSIAEVQGGIQKQPKRRPVSNRYPFLRVANVLRGRLDLGDVHEVELFDGEIERYRLQSGDLLVVEGNGSPDQIGRAARWLGEIENCVHQNHLIRVRPKAAIDPRYLTYYWNAPQTTNYLRSIASSTSGLYVLTAFKVRSVRIPLAPIGEQLRIVAAIEEQFSRLDAGVAALGRVRRNLNGMRAAALQAAVTGKLVPQDPTDQPAYDWLGTHDRAAHDKAGDLPPGWARTTVGELKTWSLYGPRFTSEDYVASGVPVLRTTDITPSGRILVDQAPKLSLSEADLRKYRVEIGDILITRTGSIGTLAYIRDDMPAIPGAYLILYRFGLPIEFSEFLFFHFQSPSVQAQLISKSAGVGRPNLNAPSIDAVVVNVPPFAEVVRIVTEVKRFLSAIEALEVDLRAADARQSRLRQAILAAAFSGKLTTRDPNDEPASDLLERVADRASSDLTRKRGRNPGLLRGEVTG